MAETAKTLKEYRWRRGFPEPKVSAQTFGETLDQMTADGVPVRPETIVKIARDRANPLHPMFEWRDKVAGEAHRVDQARRYIGGVTCVRVHIESTGQDVDLREFMLVRRTPEEPKTYLPRRTIVSSEYLREQMFRQIERQLDAYLRRYHAELSATTAWSHLESAMEAIRSELDLAALGARERPARRPRRTIADDSHTPPPEA